MFLYNEWILLFPVITGKRNLSTFLVLGGVRHGDSVFVVCMCVFVSMGVCVVSILVV